MWTAYSTEYTGEDKDMLLAKHSNPSNYDGTFQVFTCMCNPINPIDTTGRVGEGEDTKPEYTAEQVIDLIRTHDGAVLLSSGMATEIMNLLKPEVIEGETVL